MKDWEQPVEQWAIKQDQAWERRMYNDYTRTDEGGELLSDCCGVPPVGLCEEHGICPECRDHCEFTRGDDDE